MNKQEWIELFEAINSHSPSEMDIEKAKQNGEFIEQKPITKKRLKNKQEWIELFEAINCRFPTGQEINTAQQKGEFIGEDKLPNTDFSNQNKINFNLNNEIITPSNNYFSWLWETMKNPSIESSGYKYYFPWITMGIMSFFISLTLTLNINNLIGSFGGYYGDLTYSYGMIKNKVNIGTFVFFFIFSSGIIYTIPFATLVGLKILGDKTTTYMNIIRRYTSLYTPIVALAVIAFLLSIIHLTSLGTILLYFTTLIISVSIFDFIFKTKNHMKLNDFYAKILAIFIIYCIISIASIILIMLFFNLITTMI